MKQSCGWGVVEVVEVVELVVQVVFSLFFWNPLQIASYPRDKRLG